MTKGGMVLKLTNRMKKHGRCNAEISFERKNIADWFDACSCSNVEVLQQKEGFLLKRLDSAEKAKDYAYLECRQLFMDIIQNFLPPEFRDLPF